MGNYVQTEIVSHGMSSNMMKHLLPKPCSRSEFNLGVDLAMFMILNFERRPMRESLFIHCSGYSY